MQRTGLRFYPAAAFILLIAFIVFSKNVSAATEGTLGSPSTGIVGFSVTKPARANITNLSDLSVTSWSIGDGDVTLTEDVCVYTTRPSGGYTVTATGTGGGGAFTLANGSHTVAYQLSWNAGGVNNLSNTGSTLTAGAVSSAFTHAATTSSSCNGSTPGPTARVIVYITSAAITAAPTGNYTGNLTLLISPN